MIYSTIAKFTSGIIAGTSSSSSASMLPLYMTNGKMNDTPISSLNPLAITYLPTPQYTYRDIYYNKQKEIYGNHFMVDKKLEELYEYIKIVENGDEYNMDTFFHTTEWEEGYTLTEKERYSWLDTVLEGVMDEVEMKEMEASEPDSFEKNKETFFYSSLWKNGFKTTQYMNMDLYLEKMEELYKIRVEKELEDNPSIDRETFNTDGLDALYDLV
jgi:hypothetical protein